MSQNLVTLNALKKLKTNVSAFLQASQSCCPGLRQHVIVTEKLSDPPAM